MKKIFLYSLVSLQVAHAQELQEQGEFVSNEHLTFSQDEQELFSEELLLPSYEPIFSQKTNPSAKVHILASYQNKGAWRLTFTFPQKVSFTTSSNGNTICIEFNQAIDSPDLQDIQEKLSFLLKGVFSGYHTLELVPQRQIDIRAVSSGCVFTLELIPCLNTSKEEKRLLQIATARLLVEERCFRAATCVLSELKKEYPEDENVLILLASLDGLLPKWQEEWRILKGLHERYPDDEDIYDLMYATYSPHSSYLLLERQLQKTVGLAIVQVNIAQAEAMVWNTVHNTLYLGTQWQLWDGHFNSIVNSQGNYVRFQGYRNQAAIYLRHDWSSGSELTGYFYAQKETVGAGLKAMTLWPAIQGNFFMLATWHRPYWALFETMAYQGREDLLYAGVNSEPTRYIDWEASLGTHRVGITGTSTAFTSVLANAEIFYYCTVGNPKVALNYGLDAEYVLHDITKTGVNGQPFNPVPYVSFEEHSFRAYFFYTWRKNWFFKLYGGETLNRLGLNAGTYGGSLKYVKPCPWGLDIELAFDHFPSTVVSGATALYYTGTITARF